SQRKRFYIYSQQHRTRQIAIYSSQKLPQRLLGTIQDRLRLCLSIDTHALAVAGWMRYVTAKDEQGRAIDVRDPLARELFDIAERAGTFAERLAPDLWEVHSIFGTLGSDPRIRSAVPDV